MKRSAVLVFALTMQSVLVSATHAKETPPPVAAPKPFVTPAPYTFELPNGLKASFIEFGTVPKVTLRAVIRAGGLNQGKHPWLPQITADYLKEGTQRRSAKDIAYAAADYGGAIAVTVDSDVTRIETDALSDSSIAALNLLAEIVTAPRLPASEFERIRQDYVRRLSVARTQAQALADDGFSKLLYGDHPYGAGLPKESDLKALTIEDVKTFYSSNFGAKRTHIYIAGRFDRAAMEHAIRSAFGQWQVGPEALINPPPPIATTAATSKVKVALIDRPGAEQSTLLFGSRVIDPSSPNFMALSVTNTILGGSLTSRITSNLREEKGWAYSPDSSLSTHVRDASWAQSADVATAYTAESIHEIIAEINKLRTTAPSADELLAVKNYRNGIFVLSDATPAGLLNQIEFMDLHRLPSDWLSTYVQRLFAVTPADVAQAALQQLDPKKMSLAVVGDMKVVGTKIKALPELNGAQFIEIKP